MTLATLLVAATLQTSARPGPTTYLVEATVYSIDTGPQLPGLVEKAGDEFTFGVHGAGPKHQALLDDYFRTKRGKIVAQPKFRVLSGHEAVFSQQSPNDQIEPVSIVVTVTEVPKGVEMNLQVTDGLPVTVTNPTDSEEPPRKFRLTEGTWREGCKGLFKLGTLEILGHYRARAGWRVVVVKLVADRS